MTLSDLRLVILSAYDAGRITSGKARDLLGHQHLLDFREEYEKWREAEDARPNRTPIAAQRIRLNQTAHAIVDATDNGEEYLEPDGTLIENLVRAAFAVNPRAVRVAISGEEAKHERDAGC